MQDDNPLDRDQCAAAAAQCACLNFRKASRAVTQLFDEALSPTGLRSTQLVLLLAIHANEPATVAALARQLVADRSTLIRNLKPLETAKLVTGPPGAGRRPRLLRLTAKGQRTVLDAIPLWQKAQSQFTGRLGKEQWSQMLTGLRDAVSAALVE